MSMPNPALTRQRRQQTVGFDSTSSDSGRVANWSGRCLSALVVASIFLLALGLVDVATPTGTLRMDGF